MATYEKGDSDEEVARFQTLIGVKADGDFGNATVAAVKAWQKARGVKSDGMVGPDMLLELGLHDLIVLEKWDEGELVRRVQQLVGVKTDGVYGDRTIEAMRTYQKSNGLKVDGVAGRRTLDRMGLLAGGASSGSARVQSPVAPPATRDAAPPQARPAPTPQPQAQTPQQAPQPAPAAASKWRWPWSKPAAAPAPQTGPAGRRQISSWAYQIADVDADAIAGLNVDLAVIDYASDGDEETAFKPADVARMKRRPDGGVKKIACYMSIGEAEDYRYYWQDSWKPGQSPAWLDALNPDWPGNFKVRYWDPDWQAIILGSPQSYLDKILAAGFDGVYLDIVDAFEYWRDDKRERRTADKDMIAFVGRIAAYARARNPEFLVIPQNGEALLEDPGYRAIVSVQAKEDIFFGADADGKPNTKSTINDCLGYLKYAREAGIPIVAVEYLEENGQISKARVQLSEQGCVAYFGPRDLASIPVEQFNV
jgi:cysteinyl-tRNA synthetase, unknown class